jgi:SpoVK/Ycf46/Vps4 family AAA+-type ATPase
MATNRIDILDPALLRPGRIDRKIEFPAPTEEARLDILKIHSRKMNLTRGINLRKIAEMMPGASGAEVKVKLKSSYQIFSQYDHLFRVCVLKQVCMHFESDVYMSHKKILN